MRVRGAGFALSLGLLLCGTARAQETSAPAETIAPVADTDAAPEAPAPAAHTYVPNTDPVTFGDTPRHFIEDQAVIFTSPARIRWQDTRYLVPLGIFTGLLIGSDHHTVTDLVHPGANDPHRASEVSDAGVAALGLFSAAVLLNGASGDYQHQKEAGILSFESLADTMVVNNIGRVILTRERPDLDNGNGKFFQGFSSGLSFPSNHAAAAWSLASVLGQEYPGPLARAGFYSLATAASIARIAGKQHFPSDVLVGSSIGWLTGQYVYRAHHDTRFTDDWGSADPAPSGPQGRAHVVTAYTAAKDANENAAQSLMASQSHLADADVTYTSYTSRQMQTVNPDTRGSVYVPMDSWVYPALDRLHALGLVPSQSSTIRPWTREECLRQVDEAEENMATAIRGHGELPGSSPAAAEEGGRLLGDLRREFADENDGYEAIGVESLYSRGTVIAGPALTRSWDFGQTLDNDYGRAFARGTNAISGFSMFAKSGRWSFYTRDEYQHAPGYSTYPASLQPFFNNGYEESVDVPPVTGVIPTVNRQRPIEMYAGYEAKGFEFQFGKQEMFWAPTYDGALAFSINAEPAYNAQIVATRPHQWPGPLAFLGTYRFDFVIGKFSGHTEPARPWYNGQKFTFNPSGNMEISITRWSLWAGVGTPFTIGDFLDNIFTFSSDLATKDPGDRKTATDFRYRLPGMRWATLYFDSYADDDVNPFASPRRSAWMPGLYLSRLPGLPHMDLRVEVPSTMLFSSDHGPDFLYTNGRFKDSNLNKDFFYGNSLGRDGRRYEGWLGYWFSGKERIEAGYRQTQRSNQLLPVTGNPATSGGGTQSDALLRATIPFSQHWSARAFTQYERWYEPILNPGSQHNITGQLEIRWEPGVKLQR